MTYEEVRRMVLELANQYSIAGEPISPAYNNQSDDLHKIPSLLNQAIMDIRTGVKPLRSVCELGREDAPGWAELPEDFWRLVSGGVRKVDGGGAPRPCNRCQISGGRRIWLSPGHYLVEYERYPEQLPVNPADTYTLEEDPEVLQAAAFFAAAHLVRTDDAFSFAALQNEYERRLSRMVPRVTAEFLPVQDAYGAYEEGGGI